MMNRLGWRRWLRKTFGTPTARCRRSLAMALETLEPRWAPSFSSVAPVPITAQEGAAFSGPVTTFTSPDSGPFTAAVDWGDGTTTAGTVSGSSGGGFTVAGTHSYAEDGAYTTRVILTDAFLESGTSLSTTATVIGTATVSEGGVSIVASPIRLVEGTAFSGQVGTFTDPGSPDPASAFTASIDWGDGSNSAGTISGSAGSYSIAGSHTYADEGSFTATLTVSETGIAGGTTALKTLVSVAEGDVLTGTGATISPTEKAAFSGAVATFKDTGYPGNSPNDFKGTIDWGNGVTSQGTVTGSNGSFTVGGGHTYAEDGTYALKITLADDTPGTASLTVNGTAQVGEADLSIIAVPIRSTQSQLFTGTVGSFTDAGSPDAATAFGAAINWGDGTTSAGTVTGAGGQFSVSGSHTYSSPGSFTLSLTVTETGVPGASAKASSASTVVSAGLLPNLLGVTENGDGTFTVFAVGADQSLQMHQDTTGWVAIGAPGTILQVTVVGEGFGQPVVFVRTTARGLSRWDPVHGWSILGAGGTIQSISAGLDNNNQASVFVITTAGDLTEFNSSGWQVPFGARGTIASISGASHGRVYVVTTDGSVMAHDDRAGWLADSGPGFATSIDTVDNTQGQVTIYAVSPNHALLQHDDATGWMQVAANGTVLSVRGGQDTHQRPDAFLLDDTTAFDSLIKGQRQQLAGPGIVRSATATSASRVYVITSDGTVLGQDPTLGAFALSGPGFARSI